MTTIRETYENSELFSITCSRPVRTIQQKRKMRHVH